MLLRDIPPERLTQQPNLKRQKYARQRKMSLKPSHATATQVGENPALVPPRTVVNNSTPVKSKQQGNPLWLKGLVVLNHGSTLLCYASIATTLVIYGMTVYAPKLWTQKYGELKELQKKERQFTYNEEILKNESAKLAEKSGSGFINPNSQQQPLFIEKVPAKTIKLNSSTETTPKTVNPVSPIAY